MNKKLGTEKNVGEQIDIAVRDVFRNGTTLDYGSTTRSNISSSATLTLKDMRKAVKAIKKGEIGHLK